MDLIYLISLWGGAITLSLLPLFCLMDIKTREIKDKFLAAYLILGLPSFILYFVGLPYTYLLISIAMCIIWVIVRKTGSWGGADTKFLMIFSLICPMNPLDLYQTNYQISFVAILGAIMIITAILFGNKKDYPMLVPISGAIILTMITGAIL